MNRAESPYDRIVDIPTRASENEMNSGERVVLCLSALSPWRNRYAKDGASVKEEGGT